MDTIIADLITDRTPQDVEIARGVKERIDDGTASEADKEAYLQQDLKGWQRYSDWNRVESVVRILSDELVNMPLELEDYAASLGIAWSTLFDVSYNPADFYGIETKTDWKIGQIPEGEDATRYLENVYTLRNAFEYETETLPITMNRLNYAGANAIESALKRLAEVVDKERERIVKTIDSVVIEAYCGEFEVECGGAGIGV